MDLDRRDHLVHLETPDRKEPQALLEHPAFQETLVQQDSGDLQVCHY